MNLAEGGIVEIDGVRYVLGREFASDASTRMFFAELSGRPVFVQFLTEMWREQRGLEDDLDHAIGELQDLQLGALHLIPERRATARIRGADAYVYVFHSLIYPRQDLIEWKSLSAQELRRRTEIDLHALFERGLPLGCARGTPPRGVTPDWPHARQHRAWQLPGLSWRACRRRGRA